MKKALLSLAVAGLALSAAHSAFAQTARPGGSTLPIFTRGSFTVHQAYRIPTVAANQVFRGATRIDRPQAYAGEVLMDAVPGVLALAAIPVSTTDPRQRLDVNAFAQCPTGYSSPFVQSYKLTKQPGASDKCPGTFPVLPAFFQYGGGVRTWWTLIYTAPGTTFTLDVTVRCLGNTGTPQQGQAEIHIDRWVWTVGVSFDSLFAVIDVLHSNALGTSEIPCIASEDMYLALKASVERLRLAYNTWQADRAANLPTAPARQSDAQARLFEMEALVIAFSAFGDCFVAEDFFNTVPPSNDMQNGAFGWTGILDTIENPCACKILVDIEKLARNLGIVVTA